MKRSEMIQNIKKDLDGSLTENQILSVMHLAECYGMKPPAYWVNEGKDSFPPDGMPCMIVEWESE